MFYSLFMMFWILFLLLFNNHESSSLELLPNDAQRTINCGLHYLPNTIGISIIQQHLIQFVEITNEQKIDLLIVMYDHLLSIDQNFPFVNLVNGYSLSLSKLIENQTVAEQFNEQLMNWRPDLSMTQISEQQKHRPRINIAWSKPVIGARGANPQFRSSLYSTKTYDYKHFQNGIFRNQSVNNPITSFYMDNSHTKYLFLVSTIESTLSFEYHVDNDELAIYLWYSFHKQLVGYLKFDFRAMTVMLFRKQISSGLTNEMMEDYDFNYGFELYERNIENNNNYWRIFIVSNQKKLILSFNANVLRQFTKKFPFIFLKLEEFFYCQHIDAKIKQLDKPFKNEIIAQTSLPLSSSSSSSSESLAPSPEFSTPSSESFDLSPSSVFASSPESESFAPSSSSSPTPTPTPSPSPSSDLVSSMTSSEPLLELKMKMLEQYRIPLFIGGMVIIAILLFTIVGATICIRTRRLLPGMTMNNDDTDYMFMDISNGGGYNDGGTPITLFKRSPKTIPVYDRWQQQQQFFRV
ncbi:uncharacterized protein LOC142597799 [Dermatophagoides farinae]|uniref:uncharacterized protein LOC142597799 n=1 Tax=Dermatophagoides farinae TaxID=6954 RepID=UPI003F648F12